MAKLGERIAGGRTSTVRSFGRDAVIKIPRPGVPEHWASIEAELAAAVHARGVATPAVLDVVQIGGFDAVVFERIDGPSMWQCMVHDRRQVPQLAKQLASVQAEIHTVTAPESLLSLRDRVCHKLDEAEALTEGERWEAQQIVRSLPDGSLLCHGDLHPGNVLMSARGPVVIDWFDCAAGDPVGDLVRTSLLIRPPIDRGAFPPHLPGADRTMLGQLHGDYLGAMFGSGTLDVDALRRWEAVLAASRLAEHAEGRDDELIQVWNSRPSLGRPVAGTPLMSSLARLGLVDDERPQ